MDDLERMYYTLDFILNHYKFLTAYTSAFTKGNKRNIPIRLAVDGYFDLVA